MNRQLSGRPRRRAGTLVEAMMAVTLAAAVSVSTAQLLTFTMRQQRLAQWRTMAGQQAANLVERLMRRPWQELPPGQLDDPEAAAWCRQHLPNGRVQIDITAADGPPAGRRIRVQIDWQAPGGQRARPVRLVAWRFAGGSARP